MKDVEVIPASSTNIWKIEVEYLKDQEKRKHKEASLDPSPAVDIDSMPAKEVLATLSIRPSSTSTSIDIPSNTLGPSTTALPPRPDNVILSWTLITQASLLQIGQLG